MRRLTPGALRTWADEIGSPTLLFAELDFRIVHILEALAQNETLSSKLYLKGGTAINKLHLGASSRLSVDIDLNHIGPKKGVFEERDEIAERVEVLLKDLDSTYETRTKKTWEKTTLRVDYNSLAGPKQRLKVEILHIERFPILPVADHRLLMPSGETVLITGYQLEELLSTKIRALHDRLKGRDIYDLWAVNNTSLDLGAIRKMFLYYFYRSRRVFNPKLFFPRLNGAVSTGGIVDDVSGFLRPDIDFKLQERSRDVVSWLGFLGDLGQADRDFVMLSRVLLGKGEVPKSKREEIAAIDRPLESLFGSEYEITEEARRATIEDITVFNG